MLNPPLKDNQAVISLGGNWGPTAHYFQQALAEIDYFAVILQKTPIKETLPVGYHHQPYFLNQLILISTDLEPHDLLLKLQAIELQLHRKRLIKMGPRTLDLDIIYYGQKKINTPKLTIPHPAVNNRQYLQDLLKLLFT